MAKKKAASTGDERGNGKINVSEAIRAYLADNPNAKPKVGSADISKLIGKKVSPAMFSQVKTKSKKGKKRGRRRGGAVGNGSPKVARAGGGIVDNGRQVFASFAAARELIQRMGADDAKKLIDLLAGS